MTLFDTHCHLNLVEHYPDPDAEIEAARRAGVERLAIVGIDVKTSRLAVEIASRHEGVFAIVGIHPNSASGVSEADLAQIRELSARPEVVAIGEIGLDYHWDLVARDEQRVALEAQLDLAEELALPVVFHCRKAYDDLLAVLEARPPRPYLLHCFSGDAGHARRAVELGAMLGFDGPITYKNAEETREIARAVPRDRLVLETDAPFLPPVPHRGKPNKPSYLPLVNAGLASALGMSAEDLAEVTTANACRFFGIALGF